MKEPRSSKEGPCGTGAPTTGEILGQTGAQTPENRVYWGGYMNHRGGEEGPAPEVLRGFKSFWV